MRSTAGASAYVLGFPFYRFISEDLAAYIDEGERALVVGGYSLRATGGC